MTAQGHSDEAIGNEQSEVWRRLRSLVEAIREEALAHTGVVSPAEPAERAITEAAKALYAGRRRRSRYFQELAGMFEEAAWDILLDLFVSEREGREVSVSSACIAANVPPTTALRWLGLLEDRGAILREPDPSDRRRINLRLSDETRAAMYAYITDVVTGRAG